MRHSPELVDVISVSAVAAVLKALAGIVPRSSGPDTPILIVDEVEADLVVMVSAGLPDSSIEEEFVLAPEGRPSRNPEDEDLSSSSWEDYINFGFNLTKF